MTERVSAEVEDPTTGELTHLEADTPQNLDRLIDEHLAQTYPVPAEDQSEHLNR